MSTSSEWMVKAMATAMRGVHYLWKGDVPAGHVISNDMDAYNLARAAYEAIEQGGAMAEAMKPWDELTFKQKTTLALTLPNSLINTLSYADLGIIYEAVRVSARAQ